MFDLSGSGRVSLQEFSDGMERTGLPWQDITGFRRMLHLFTLFDQNRDGVVDLEEFFPSDIRNEDGYVRNKSTPVFWESWCEWSDLYTDRIEFDERNGQGRSPQWGAMEPQQE